MTTAPLVKVAAGDWLRSTLAAGELRLDRLQELAWRDGFRWTEIEGAARRMEVRVFRPRGRNRWNGSERGR